MQEIRIDAPTVRSLSPQQKRVNELIEAGKTQPQICKTLHISYEELHDLMSGIREKGHTLPTVRMEKKHDNEEDKILIEKSIRDEIRARYAAGGISQLELANEYDVSHGTVSNFCKGITPALKKEEDKPVIIAPDFAEMISADKKEAPAPVAQEADANALTGTDIPVSDIIPPPIEFVKKIPVPDCVRQTVREKIEHLEAEARRREDEARVLMELAGALKTRAEDHKRFLITNGLFDEEDDK